MSFQIEPLSSGHDRKAFMCGNEILDRYLREQANQDIKRRVSQCYVAIRFPSPLIAGFYTLSAGDVALEELPDAVARKLPRYPQVPVARVGRLAIGTEFQGQGLGAALLWDAIDRVLRAEMGMFAIAVDAKDEQAVAFYKHFGFQGFNSRADRLFLPLSAMPKRA